MHKFSKIHRQSLKNIYSKNLCPEPGKNFAFNLYFHRKKYNQKHETNQSQLRICKRTRNKAFFRNKKYEQTNHAKRHPQKPFTPPIAIFSLHKEKRPSNGKANMVSNQ